MREDESKGQVNQPKAPVEKNDKIRWHCGSERGRFGGGGVRQPSGRKRQSEKWKKTDGIAKVKGDEPGKGNSNAK